jgi:hypothetical protein
MEQRISMISLKQMVLIISMEHTVTNNSIEQKIPIISLVLIRSTEVVPNNSMVQRISMISLKQMVLIISIEQIVPINSMKQRIPVISLKQMVRIISMEESNYFTEATGSHY